MYHCRFQTNYRSPSLHFIMIEVSLAWVRPYHNCRSWSLYLFQAMDRFWAAPPVTRYIYLSRIHIDPGMYWPVFMGLGLWPPLHLSSQLWSMVVCLVAIVSSSYQSCCSNFRLIYGDLSRLSYWPGHGFHSSLIFTFVWNLLARSNNGANLRPVFTYGSGLETDSPRFSLPGDFFTYVIFVATVILVSCELCPEDHCKNSTLEHINFILLKLPLSLFSYTFLSFLSISILFTSHYLPARPNFSRSGSWKRGRLPLLLAQSLHWSFRGCVRCGNGGIAFEIASVTIYSRWFLWCPTL